MNKHSTLHPFDTIRRVFSWVGHALLAIPLWVYPLLLTLVLFMPVRYVYFNSDGVGYLGQALNISHGLGLVGLDQVTPLSSRLLFPLFMSLPFRLFGPSDLVAFMFIRAFYIVAVLLVYALGKRLFGRYVGLLASLLVLTSFSVNEWCTIVNMDCILAAVQMLSMLVLYLAFEGKKLRWFVLAGITLSAGFLLKETALALYAMPALMWLIVPAYRSRDSLFGVIVTMVVLAGVTGAWLAYASSAVSQSSLLLGNPGQDTAQSIGGALQGSALLHQLGRFAESPLRYYQMHLEPNFLYAPIFLLAWTYVLLSAVRGENRHPNRVLLVFLLPFFPQVIYQGLFGFRASQGLAIFFLCYLALAELLWATALLVQRLWHRPQSVSRTRRILGKLLPVILISVIVLVQAGERQSVYSGRPVLQIQPQGRGNMLDHIRRFSTPAYLLNPDGSWITGLEWSDDVSQWISRHIPEDTALMVDSKYAARVLFWKTQGRFPIFALPWLRSSQPGSPAQWTDSPPGKVLFLEKDAGGQRTDLGAEPSQWKALTEGQILSEIQATSAEYVVVGWDRFILKYLMENPAFALVANFGDAQIFQVLSTDPAFQSFRTNLVDDSFAELLSFQRVNPTGYEHLETEFLSGTLHLSEADLTELQAGGFPSIGRDYSYDAYLAELESQEPGKIHNVMDIQQQVASLSPSSPWPYVTIGSLLVALGEYDAALEAYRQAALRSQSSGNLGSGWDTITRYVQLEVKSEYELQYLLMGSEFRSAFASPGQSMDAYPTLDLQDSLPGAKGTCVSNSVFVLEGEPRGVLYSHPFCSATIQMDTSSEAELHFGLALAPEVWEMGKGDGVRFDIYIDDGRTEFHPFSEYIDPKNIPEHRTWHDREIDLSPWAGQTITLTLTTSPGPNGDDGYDWAGWGEPRIVQPIAYDFLAELPNADRAGAEEKLVRQDTQAIDYQSRAILFQHPSNQVTYRLEIPQGAGLHFGLGLDPAVWAPDKGDGVEYNIYVRDPDAPYVLHRVYNHYLDPKNDPDNRHWLDQFVDLSDYGGQTIDLIFEALPGPLEDASFDWGGWSMPVLVADDMAILNPAPPVTGSPQDHQP